MMRHNVVQIREQNRNSPASTSTNFTTHETSKHDKPTNLNSPNVLSSLNNSYMYDSLNNIYKCAYCLRIYSRKYGLAKHQKNYPNKSCIGVFRCLTCNKPFYHEKESTRHICHQY